MRPERIAFLLLLIPVLISFWVFRKKITYFWAPNEIVSNGELKKIGALHLLITLLLALGIHLTLDSFFYLDDKLDERTFPRIIIILSELIISASVIGILIDKYIAATNPEFKAWRKLRQKRRKKN